MKEFYALLLIEGFMEVKANSVQQAAQQAREYCSNLSHHARVIEVFPKTGKRSSTPADTLSNPEPPTPTQGPEVA